ncbi:MAG: hypothetical protein M1835_004172 [Candelina submexicana]|nr:MAG: hypothetical protein M1835_004172 [Candelina submexicana]
MATQAPATRSIGGAQVPADTTSSHKFTCNACQVAFRTSDVQRGHMRSDWHLYNVKRRLAALPPITSEVFAEKVLTAQASSTAAAAKASFEKACIPCQKTYFSDNAYQNHLGSQKHKMRLASLQNGGVGRPNDETGSVLSSTFSLGEPVETSLQVAQDPEVEAEFSKVVDGIKEASLKEEEPVPRRPTRPHHSAAEARSEHPLSPATTNDSATPAEDGEPKSAENVLRACLFCNYDSPSLSLNVIHMAKVHGMFIPEQAYLTDLEGLVRYLYEKVYETHECLHCHKGNRTVNAAQAHMRDKGHCVIPYDSEEDMIEIGDFYDFRSTYSDPEDDVEDTDIEGEETPNKSDGGVKLGARREEEEWIIHSNIDGEAGKNAEGDEGEGWETDSSASSLDSADLTAVPLDHSHAYNKRGQLVKHRHHSHCDPRPHHSVDGWHSHAHHQPMAVYHDEYELHLPSGRTAGHRQFAKYYRQNLHNHPTHLERRDRQAILAASSSNSDEEDDSLVVRNGRGRQLTTRANGGLGMLGVTDAKKREVRATEKRARKIEQRARAQYQWGVNKQANSQKHFRDPLLQ